MTRLVIVVFGEPAPQGSKKFVGMTKPKPGQKQGRGILVESSKKVAPWRQDVSASARAAHNGAEPLDGPLRVRMVFTVPKSMSATKKKQRTYPCTMPDLSKLCRSTEDTLKTAAVIKDDSRIVEYARLAKVFPNEDPESLVAPGVRITIETIEEEAPIQAKLA